MSPSSGSAVFTLLGNLTFTLFGMIGAFINWYIVDQKTVGVIIVFFFMMMGYFYWIAKYPRFLIAIVAGALTHVLIIGKSPLFSFLPLISLAEILDLLKRD